MASDCLFCRIAAGEIPAEKIHEDPLAVAFADINPAAPMHILIIPRKHIATLDDLGPDDSELIGHLHQVARNIAREKGLTKSGYRLTLNCGADAGQVVFHLHLHLLGGRKFTWPPG